MNAEKSIAKTEINDLKIIKDAFKPGLFAPVLLTLVCIAPYLWLFIDIAEQRYDRLLMLSLISGACIVVITLTWAFYGKNYRAYKEEVDNYVNDPKTFRKDNF